VAHEVAIEVLADGGIRMGGLVTLAAVQATIGDANERAVHVAVSGAVDAALGAAVIDALRHTGARIEVAASSPAPWPHRWSSVQYAAEGGLVAELEDLLARGAAATPRRGSSAPSRLAMSRGHVPALVALRAAGVRPPRGAAPPASMPDAVVLRTWLPAWTWSVVVGTAVIGVIGLLATRHWAFGLVAVSGAVLVGIGNAAVGLSGVAIAGPRLAVRPVARWHGPYDLRALTSIDYRPAPSSRMTARWRLTGPAGPVPDIVAGHDFMTPGFERHLWSWLDPAHTAISPSAAGRLRAHADAPL
jgi:hypothetical protein